ncbi:MAG: DNA primase [Firmicutes bacterium]|nr:DNA primase [Bacillota bacterium]
MFYSDEVLMDVRLGNDIVDVISEYVKLKKSGANYFGLCPFHNEKTASFSVNPEKQIYRCFGCGAGGNVFKFIQQKENLSFPESVEYLAKRINYQLPQKQTDEGKRRLKQQLYDIHKTAARFYYDCLNADMGRAASKYLDKRGIEPGIRKKFGLGYSPDSWSMLYDHLLEKGFDTESILKSGLVNAGKSGKYYDNFRNRLMFPIIDVYGNIIAFGARKLREEDYGGKYLNSSDTEIFNKGYNLYNINYARLARKNELIIVEGYMDVITMYQAGFKNVIAALGTAFTRNQAAAIGRFAKNVTVLFDSDEAGVSAVLRALPVLRDAGISAKVLQVRDAKDPDEYIKSYGAEAFAKLMSTSSVNATIFRIETEKKKFDLGDTDGKIAFTNAAVHILAETENPVELDIYIKRIAEDMGISREALLKEVNRVQGVENDKKENVELSRRVKSVQANNALDEAKSGLLNIVASDKKMYERVERVFDKKEFADELYIRLYEIIGTMHSQNRPVHEADVVTYLEDASDDLQSQAARIFMTQLSCDTDEQRYRALADDLKIIKNSYIDKLMEEADDDQFLQLVQQKKNVDNIIKGL